MRSTVLTGVALVLSLAAAEAKKPACFPIDWDTFDQAKLNPNGDDAVMLGPCVTSAVPPDEVDVGPGGTGNWWGIFSCGYAAYRDGKAARANPFRRNTELKDAWAKGWDKAKLDCSKGGWWDEEAKTVIEMR
jgi:hypothetical protein